MSNRTNWTGAVARWCAVLLLGALGVAQAQRPPAKPGKKIVLIAGPITGHPKNAHEYERSVILLKQLLDTSPSTKGLRTEAYFNGWPENEAVLDDADTIVLVTDGGDRKESDHPLYVGSRFQTLERQMKRGCGLVQFHWTTFNPSRYHEQITEWVGGYFDYEKGPAANHWFSKIQHWEGPTSLGDPKHPILRGVQPPTLKEEFYYNIRFRENDPRLTPILLTKPPNETQDFPVGWAVQRKEGGRGFGFTGGHHFDNWWNKDFRKLILNAIVWTARGEIPRQGIETTLDAPDKVLIITGHNHPAHEWRGTTAALIGTLEQDPRLRVEVTENPEDLAAPNLRDYRLLVLNYCNWDRPGLSNAAKENFVKYLREGGGLSLIHFANGAFNYTLPAKDSEWPEYRTGIVARAWMHDSDSGHDAFGPFHVTPAKVAHPIIQGLAPFDTMDELYFRQKGPKPVTPLLTAHSKVTNQDEPLGWAYDYGQGRIFQTLLGHSDVSIRRAAAFIRRGSIWAARRDNLTFDPPTNLLENQIDRDGAQWTVAKSRARASLPPAVAAGNPLGEGRFGKALDARGGGALASGRSEYSKQPLTVEFWAKLLAKETFNILVASEPKSSASHWEIFTWPGTGALTVYAPGHQPDHVRTTVNICDGQWHAVSMVFTAQRIRLLVDGKQVADEVVSFKGGQTVPGPLGLGRLAEGGLNCSGYLDDIRITSAALELKGAPTAPLTSDDNTVGLWRCDAVEGGKLADSSRSGNAATVVGTAVAAAEPEKPAGPLPVIDARTSLDWRAVSNDPGGQRYSPLTQINRKNVSQLQVAWTYKTGEISPGSTIECTPIVVDGVMYLTTVKLKVVALEAATGREIWKYDPVTGGVNRGVAYWSDGRKDGQRRILLGTPDGRLISLDARSGKPDPAFGRGGTVALREGYANERDLSRVNYGCTSAPSVFQNLVYVPIINSEGQPGAPGDIRAFDVRTGREAWRFHTVPRPGEIGNDTWAGDSWKERSGANAWAGYTVDAENGILFAGIGSPASDFYGGDRKGDNLFGNCVLALDARTGKYLWHFQTVRHDLWDHDNPCPPVLVTVRHGGKRVEAVAQVTKTGYCYVLERKTGRPLFDVKQVPAPPSDVPGEQAAAAQPEPVKPPALSRTVFNDAEITNLSPENAASVREKLKSLRYGKANLPPSLQGTVVFPGYHGGATWSGAGVDPDGILYVNMNDVPWIAKLRPNGAAGGYDFTGYDRLEDKDGLPACKPPWGTLNAVDLNKGEIVWKVPFGEIPELKAKGIPPTGTESFGGVIVTAGGLVFIAGTRDEKMHAFDKSNGKLLWEVPLPAGGYATPSTYQVNGRQFVVIAAGGGGKLRTRSGDSFIAFALPRKNASR